MYQRIRSLFLPGLLLFPFIVKAGLQPIFRHLSAEDGLTSSSAKCVFKDHLGFLWIGTPNGLNRFDGKNIVSYVHSPADSASLINNDVNGICEDESGCIWVATHGGISRLDREQKRFTNYLSEGTGEKEIPFYKGVPSIVYFKGRVWAGLRNGFAWKGTGNDTEHFHLLQSAELHSTAKKVECLPNMAFVNERGIWFSTFQGMFYSPDGNIFFNKEYDPGHEPCLSRGAIMGFYDDGDSLQYFSNWNFTGLYIYNYKINKLDSLSAKGVSAFTVRSLCKVSDHVIWGATILSGIAEMDLRTGNCRLIAPARFNPQSLSSAETLQLLRDDQGTIFIPTSRGLDYVNALQTQFRIYRNDPADEHSFPTESPYDVVEDSSGMLWMGTMKSGMYSLDPSTGRTAHFELPGDYNRTWNLFYDEGKIMVSTDGGLGYFDPRTKKFSPATGLPPEVNDDLTGFCTFILKDKDGNHWFGLWQNGILKYNFKTKQYIYFSKSDSLHKLETQSPMCGMIDKEDHLWFGHIETTAISCLDMKDNSVVTYTLAVDKTGHNNGFTASMEPDDDGNIWIGSSQGGLYRFDPRTKKFTSYDVSGGLSNNLVIGIQNDHRGHLWVSTSHGLDRYDLKTGKITSWFQSDGLPSDQFEDNPFLLSRSGKIFSGCDEFLVCFHPDSLLQDPHVPGARILDYSISGIKNNVTEMLQDIFLSYKDKAIAFEFTAPDFIAPERIQYQYMLDGFDPDWIDAGKRTFAQYTNLPEGDYTFRVRAGNHFAEWTGKESVLHLHVDGPFWKKWWFFFLCFLFVAGSISFVYYVRLRQILKLQAIRNKISQDLHDEIGSSLSSISLSSEVAKTIAEEKAPEAVELLASIGESARSAIENMSDIVWAINPKNDRFTNIMQRLQAFAQQLFDVKNIRLHFEVPDDVNGMKMSMQHRKNIYLVLKEAINNVAKYSQAENCFVVVQQNGKQVQVQVKDDGVGFVPKTGNLGGNGLVNMKQRIEELNGIFNIFSEERKGTTLSFRFEH